MKTSRFLSVVFILIFLFCPLWAHAQEHQHEFGVPPAPAIEEQTEPPESPQMCSPEHMRMMLQTRADRECVAETVLQDEATTEIIMNKIVADPQLRKRMMERMHQEMQKRMMEPKGEGGMMEHGGMMHGEGGMMQEQGGMMQKGMEESAPKGGSSE